MARRSTPNTSSVMIAARARRMFGAIVGAIVGASACGSSIVPYQTYDNAMNRAVAGCLDNQSTITTLQAAGAALAMAAGGQGLSTLGLEGDINAALAVSSAISGLTAAGLAAMSLGIQSRMKMKSCESLIERYHNRIDLEIEVKKAGGPEPKWWPAAQETYDMKLNPANDKPVKPAKPAEQPSPKPPAPP